MHVCYSSIINYFYLIIKIKIHFDYLLLVTYLCVILLSSLIVVTSYTGNMIQFSVDIDTFVYIIDQSFIPMSNFDVYS